MRRIVVWIDCDANEEEKTRRKVEEALARLDVEYTILIGSSELFSKGPQK